MDYKKLSKVMDMARLNRKETHIFPQWSYDVYVNSDDHDPPHFHIHSKQEDYDVRVDFDGNVISVKHPGKRKSDDVMAFADVQKKAKRWLAQVPASQKVAELYETNRDYALFEWPD